MQSGGMAAGPAAEVAAAEDFPAGVAVAVDSVEAAEVSAVVEPPAAGRSSCGPYYYFSEVASIFFRKIPWFMPHLQLPFLQYGN